MNDERRLVTGAATLTAEVDDTKGVRPRPSAAELVATPGAVISRTDLRELGLPRRAVDSVFRALPVIVLPGYSRPLVRVEDYLELIAASTYRDDRVRAS